GRPERRRLGRAGQLRGRPAGLPALHPFRGLGHRGGAGGAAVRRPRRPRPLAPPPEPRPDLAASARPAGPDPAEPRRPDPAGRVHRRMAGGAPGRAGVVLPFQWLAGYTAVLSMSHARTSGPLARTTTTIRGVP